MKTDVQTTHSQVLALEQVLINGDLSQLTPEQRTSYYMKICESVGMNHLTRPFEYIKLNGRLTLYAKKDATDQLRKIHGVSVSITSRDSMEGVYIVAAKAKNKDGREDESIGAVNIQGLRGDNLANAIMKAETKAKRRVTLSICGLGFLDETEIETIHDAVKDTPLVQPNLISKEQFLELQELAKKQGYSVQELTEFMIKRTGAQKGSELTWGKWKDLVAYFKENAKPIEDKDFPFPE